MALKQRHIWNNQKYTCIEKVTLKLKAYYWYWFLLFNSCFDDCRCPNSTTQRKIKFGRPKYKNTAKSFSRLLIIWITIILIKAFKTIWWFCLFWKKYTRFFLINYLCNYYVEYRPELYHLKYFIFFFIQDILCFKVYLMSC